VLKIFLYVAGVLILGAALAPVLYNLGKGLAETTAHKQTNHVVKWLADAAARSPFPRFFDRTMLFSGLVLLFPLLALLRRGKGDLKFIDTPWAVRLSGTPAASDLGQPLRPNRHGWIHLICGFLVAGCLLMLSGWLMVRAGFFVWKDAPASATGEVNAFMEKIQWGKAAKAVLPGAIIVAIIEEILFRGVLLGIFMRAMRPGLAIATLSLLFAFVHFLSPPPGASVADPDAANAGFVLLGQIFSRYADPVSLLSRFMVLAAVGVVLANARYRTASLWLPIGLHAGWVLGVGMFKAATWPAKTGTPMMHWIVGDTLIEGLLPLSIVIFTGFLVQVLTHRDPDEDF
jgi:membrane protease YdiL (CAAX protease family)